MTVQIANVCLQLLLIPDDVATQEFFYVWSAISDHVVVSEKYNIRQLVLKSFQGLYPTVIVALVELQRSIMDDVQNTFPTDIIDQEENSPVEKR
jgi:hypothetical protein